MSQINGIINRNTNFSINKKEDKKVNEEVSKEISPKGEFVKVPQGVILATLGVVKSSPVGEKEPLQSDDLDSFDLDNPTFVCDYGFDENSTEGKFINSLPFSNDLTTEDKIHLSTVLEKKDEEAQYLRQFINLACENKVTPKATTLLCDHSKMSDNIIKDLKTYNHAKENDIPLEEAFCPTFASQKEADKQVAAGDVFKIDGEENIYVKKNDNDSIQLKMDRETYMELFPPINRFASCQGSVGDCYLLSTMNSIMDNPYSRSAIYECFTQKGNDVEVKLPNGFATAVFPNKNLPENCDKDKYSEGSTGIKLLEHVYGKELEAKKNKLIDSLMEKEISKMENQLFDLRENHTQNDSTQKKQQKLEKKIENWKIGKARIEEARKNPNNNLAFVTNAYDDFVIGKYGPVVKPVNQLRYDYNFPSDYYRGGYGGFPLDVLQNFGFSVDENKDLYITGEDDKKLDEILNTNNPDKYLITASTYPDDDGVEVPQAIDYSIISSHAYKILPYDSEDGERRFKVTNPWNQSHIVDLDAEKLKEFFWYFSVAKLP